MLSKTEFSLKEIDIKGVVIVGKWADVTDEEPF